MQATDVGTSLPIESIEDDQWMNCILTNCVIPEMSPPLAPVVSWRWCGERCRVVTFGNMIRDCYLSLLPLVNHLLGNLQTISPSRLHQIVRLALLRRPNISNSVDVLFISLSLSIDLKSFSSNDQNEKWMDQEVNGWKGTDWIKFISRVDHSSDH